MDGGTFSPVNHYFTGEIVAVSATATACAAWIASHVRRQTVRRREPSASTLRESLKGSTAKLLLAGEYRGRNVTMMMAGEWLNVTVRAGNRERIFAEFGSVDRLQIPWLSAACRRRLSAVSAKWSVAVRGSNILLSCYAIEGPERLRCALDVACDVAEAVDQVGISSRCP
jgi:predicted membrane chloride channel (bestrophin family)